MNVRSATARSDLRARGDWIRLALWLLLVGMSIALAYGSRAGGDAGDTDALYEYSTAWITVANYAILLGLVLAIATLRRDLLALRRPRSIAQAAGLLLAVLVGVYVVEGIYAELVHFGGEQGLTPDEWEPRHAAAYVLNGVVLCTVVPLVEELMYRGLGFSLLERFGRWFAIVAVGILFALAHGLVLSLPVLALFGCAVAWIRARTASVFPGIVLHGLFNGIALVAAVTIGG